MHLTFPCWLTITLALLSSRPASAAFIGGSQIHPSTDLSSVGSWSIDQIADGITDDSSPFNGFVSQAQSGIISLALDKDYDLSAFVLWNDVNVTGEGISQFQLNFYDSNSSLLSTSGVFTGPVLQRDPATYTFGQVDAVRRVDLVVLSCNVGRHFTRIEIREVGFQGAAQPNRQTLTIVPVGSGARGSYLPAFANVVPGTTGFTVTGLADGDLDDTVRIVLAYSGTALTAGDFADEEGFAAYGSYASLLSSEGWVGADIGSDSFASLPTGTEFLVLTKAATDGSATVDFTDNEVPGGVTLMRVGAIPEPSGSLAMLLPPSILLRRNSRGEGTPAFGS